MGPRLTRKLQLKAFTRVLTVGDKLKPHAAGSAVYAGAEHFGAAKGAQQTSRTIGAIVDLGGTRNTYWKTFYSLLQGPNHPGAQAGTVPLKPVKLSQPSVWLDETSRCCSAEEQDSHPGGSASSSSSHLSLSCTQGCVFSTELSFQRCSTATGKNILSLQWLRCALTPLLFKKNTNVFFSFLLDSMILYEDEKQLLTSGDW